MTPDLNPNIQIVENISQAEAILRQFLYYAIYVPPNSAPPNPEIVDQPELSRYYLGRGRKGDYAAYAVLEDQVIGAAWVRLFSADDPGYGTIDPDIPELSIAVHPDFRNHGIGSRLLAAILTRIQPHFRAVSLSVAAANPAQHLYERVGFSVHSKDEKSLMMVKHFDTIAPHSNRD